MIRREAEVGFLLADLSGYTALTEVHGDTHAAQALTRYEHMAQAALQPGARLLERVGDEVLKLRCGIHVEVLTGQERDRGIAIDPVCHMQVQRDAAPARLPYGDQTYYFCSFTCARTFAERPQDYR